LKSIPTVDTKAEVKLSSAYLKRKIFYTCTVLQAGNGGLEIGPLNSGLEGLEINIINIKTLGIEAGLKLIENCFRVLAWKSSLEFCV